MDVGEEVPIPTLALLPNTIDLLVLTKALTPIAVALNKFSEATFALYPIAVFPVPPTFTDKAPEPTATF